MVFALGQIGETGPSILLLLRLLSALALFLRGNQEIRAARTRERDGNKLYTKAEAERQRSVAGSCCTVKLPFQLMMPRKGIETKKIHNLKEEYKKLSCAYTDFCVHRYVNMICARRLKKVLERQRKEASLHARVLQRWNTQLVPGRGAMLRRRARLSCAAKKRRPRKRP